MHAGIAPGLANLIVAGLLAGHPEADEIEVAFTVSAKAVPVPPERLRLTSSPRPRGTAPP